MAFFNLGNSKQDLYSHLDDLRKLIIINIFGYLICFSICFIYSRDIYNIFSTQLLDFLLANDISTSLITTSVMEFFFTNIKLAFFTSLVIYSPLGLIIIFIFMLSSLKRKEKKIGILLILLSPILFLCGLLFAYFVLLPIIWKFFILFYNNTDVKFLPKVSEYISFILSILFSTAIAFELPISLTILAYFNLLKSSHIIKFGKYAIVGAFVIAAVLTPPDPFSQIVVAMLLILLYYSSYWLIRFIE